MKHKTLKKFESRIMPIPYSGCWEWLGYIGTHGYGYFGLNYKVLRAHRLSYKIYKGDIPSGMSVLHYCDNPSCVNPDHLWVGTHTDNMRDKIKKGRAGLTGRRNKKRDKLKMSI